MSTRFQAAVSELPQSVCPAARFFAVFFRCLGFGFGGFGFAVFLQLLGKHVGVFGTVVVNIGFVDAVDIAFVVDFNVAEQHSRLSCAALRLPRFHPRAVFHAETSAW